MTEPRVLVFGTSGNVARELARTPWPAGWHARCKSADFTQVDKTGLDHVLDREAPCLVVNATGYTQVDQAEDERDLAFAVNAQAPGLLAESCAARGLKLIHLSTDYVFDGAKAAPYVETDPINPLSVYARTKAAGEEAVRAHLAAHVIVRTSWVFSPFSRNFVKTMLRLAAERDEIDVVADQRGCPTAAADLARVIVAVAERLVASDAPPYGTYHYAGAGAVTWYDFARAIFAEAGPLGFAVPRVIRPVSTADFGAKAPRPMNSVLDCRRFAAVFGVARRPWPQALTACLKELAATRDGPEPNDPRA